MTDAQEQILSKVNELLREHFTASLLTVQCEVDDNREGERTYWHGGYATGVGLAALTHKKMLAHCEREPEED